MIANLVSFPLNKNVLTWGVIFKVEGTPMCFSLSRDPQMLPSHEREGLYLKGLSLREKKFDLRESLSLSRNDLLYPTLGVILFSVGVTFSPR